MSRCQLNPGTTIAFASGTTVTQWSARGYTQAMFLVPVAAEGSLSGLTLTLRGANAGNAPTFYPIKDVLGDELSITVDKVEFWYHVRQEAMISDTVQLLASSAVTHRRVIHLMCGT